MAKRALHASDTQTAKHIAQSAIHAHEGSRIFMPRNMFTMASEGVDDAGKGILLDASGLIDSSLLSGRGIIPIGAILPYLGGYFTNGSNSGFTMVMATANTVVALNTLVNPDGFYVCDGAVLNDVDSPIFNGAGRYLPNITDDRFLMGDTLAGGIGGSSTMAHTHPSAFTVGDESSHTHGIGSYVTAGGSAHSHGLGTFATVNEAVHTHAVGTYAVGAHQHIAPVGYEGGKGIEITEDWGTSSETHQVSWTPRSAYESRTASWFKTKTETPSFGGASAAGSAHNHTFTGSLANESAHTHTLSGSSAVGSVHTHALTGNTGAASDSENRPKYLSCFYIMRVK